MSFETSVGVHQGALFEGIGRFGADRVKKVKLKKEENRKGKIIRKSIVVLDVLEVLHLCYETPIVTMMDAVKDIRPHILVFLRNVDLVSENNQNFMIMNAKKEMVPQLRLTILQKFKQI
uniref:Uncharacterized protein n=1 Tax=Strigamia maritima TaxID=126957 RepID=T1IGQ6_STRMM